MEKARKKILLVDDNITNLTIGRNILMGNYDVFTLQSGEKLFKMLAKVSPDLILLDVEMPEMDGYGVIKLLKADEKTRQIPVIFLTAKSDSGSELEGLNLGAVDYIFKPFSPPLLLKRIELHLLVEAQKQELKNYNENLQEMVDQKTKTVMELQNAVLQTVAEMVEYREDLAGGHVDRTQQYLRILAEALEERKISPEDRALLEDEFFIQSGQLHDVGKIAIQDVILRKNTRLTEDEFEEMKNHAAFGVKVIEKIGRGAPETSFLEHAKIFAETHHERWDGSGYPRGLKGREIPLHGRIMAIVDVYNALVSRRPYKNAFSHEKAVDIIAAGRGTHFDPELTDVFVAVADRFGAAAQTA